jgi:hypothetical protein
MKNVSNSPLPLERRNVLRQARQYKLAPGGNQVHPESDGGETAARHNSREIA